MVHFLTDLAIYTVLSCDPNTDLLGPFTAADAYVEPLRVLKTIYHPAPFVALFLEIYLMLTEASNRLRGTIVDAGHEVDCRPIVH